MAAFYDARGNLYGVVAPAALRRLGVALPTTAAQAARDRRLWTEQAIAALCDWAPGTRPPGAKAHRSDGLLVGPFQDAAPFDLLIVNTDGTLAERSGNGLTIFSQALTEQGLLAPEGSTRLQVHHDQGAGVSPVATVVEPAQVAGQAGFWLDLGQPSFGPEAVAAMGVEAVTLDGCELSRVAPLQALNPLWEHSQFVRIGNPHCVTLVEDADALPDNPQMLQAPLAEGLTAIAFALPLGHGEPCPAGVNLQWAARQSAQRIVARVFERGEGPTASSGTSASAVACAAWRVGWVQAGRVEVLMPGGTAPLMLQETDGVLTRVSLFGTALALAE
ncbi:MULTISPECIES: DeoR family transcriptional regulator [Pseudomonas]|uniref:Diaminopimelate epimerase n=1 Tax=Pseudomonas sp. W17 TaxID=3144407 RepID=A0AAU7WQS3_9PSED|nr:MULTISPECIES: DeoR family transcriptional regulator [Pseudomonas]MBB1617190.1 diaminopimelate epimerase [Pseudomonas sp. UMC65]MBB1618464.1 diaminopimelate epimerase [Pseudomonas sp. UME65]MDK1399009.1 diaminopimelate epimerase [Pseudomonas protegens]WRV89658.1 diaminopimelate epimerase [Pseudomonas protegens]BAO63478.1 diaminopimelate epimerase [Pseudomonas protegens Cab57]